MAWFFPQGVIRGELMSSYERRLKVCWERGGRAADAGVVEFVAQSLVAAEFSMTVALKMKG